MASVVFLRAVNVGGTNRCQPAQIARRLAKFGVVNLGAVGTFVVRENVSEPNLRAAFARELPFRCEMMICPARDLLQLASRDPFAGEPSGSDLMRFVSLLARRPSGFPLLPLSLPSDDDWLLRVIAIQGRFLIGHYHRQMRAISYLGKLERQLGIAMTTRNWNTIEKVIGLVRQLS